MLDLVENSLGRTSCLLALTEVQSTFHRHFRENKLDHASYTAVSRDFEADQAAELWRWLPLSESLMRHAAARLQSLPVSIFLRSADCIHLCAAAEAGFKKIYSNDRHLLAAAPHFGLHGIDVIPSS